MRGVHGEGARWCRGGVTTPGGRGRPWEPIPTVTTEGKWRSIRRIGVTKVLWTPTVMQGFAAQEVVLAGCGQIGLRNRNEGEIMFKIVSNEWKNNSLVACLSNSSINLLVWLL